MGMRWPSVKKLRRMTSPSRSGVSNRQMTAVNEPSGPSPAAFKPIGAVNAFVVSGGLGAGVTSCWGGRGANHHGRQSRGAIVTTQGYHGNSQNCRGAQPQQVGRSPSPPPTPALAGFARGSAAPDSPAGEPQQVGRSPSPPPTPALAGFARGSAAPDSP